MLWGIPARLTSASVLSALLYLACDPGVMGEATGIRRAADAILSGDTEALARLVGADPALVTGVNGDRISLLHLAVQANSLDAVKYLLQAKADIAAGDSTGESALDLVCRLGRMEILKHLKAAGELDKQGTPVLLSAASAAIEGGNTDALGICIEGIKNIDTLWLHEVLLHRACYFGRTEMVKLLLNRGADPNKGTESLGYTGLDLALDSGAIGVADVLLQAGARFKEDVVGRFAIHRLASDGVMDSLEFVLKNGEAPDTRDKRGRRPLHLAAGAGRLSTVRLLLKYGADANCRDDSGRTPLFYAVESGRRDVAQLLAASGGKVNVADGLQGTPLETALDNGRMTLADDLLKLGARIDVKTSMEPTLLHESARRGRIEAVKWLVEHGADTEVSSRMRGTPLELAAEQGREEIVAYLLDAGKERPGYKDRELKALKAAILSGRQGVVRLLKKRGTSLPPGDGANESIVHALKKYPELRHLLELKAPGH